MDAKSKTTQGRRVLSMLREHGSVTALDLIADCGICSPRKRISELKQNGYEITDAWEEGQNRYGEPVRYKRYFLKETATSSGAYAPPSPQGEGCSERSFA